MKSLLTLIAVIALAAPAFAQLGTVDITCVDSGSGIVTIGYANGLDIDGITPADISGVSMIVTLSGGDGVLLDCVGAASAAPFNANIDYFEANLPALPVLGAGCPVGLVGGPGLPIFPATSFAISTGVLGTPAPAGAAAAGGTICTIQLTGTTDTTVTLTADIDRGGVVGFSTHEDPPASGTFVTGTGELVASFPAPTVIAIGVVVPPCVPVALGSQHTDWIAFGEPACWCTPYHCDGDADTAEQGLFAAKHRVGTNDLNMIVGQWQFKSTTVGFNPCADIDHKSQGLFAAKHRVGTNDLNILVGNWQAKTADLPGTCPRL